MSMLSTITLICRPTRDPELQTSKKGEPYTRLDVAVNKGYGDKEHVNYYSGWLKGDAADRIIRAGVKKGSLIYLTGELDQSSYTRKDGTTGTANNIDVASWGYVSSGKAKADGMMQDNEENQYGTTPDGQSELHFEEIRDDDDLPF